MSTIIISDTHIGDSRSIHEQAIVDMLNSEKYDRLILNGDIIDCWIVGYVKKAKKSVLVKAIRRLAKHKKVVWIAGNHDPVDASQTLLPGIKVHSMYRFDEKYLVFHGHQAYPLYDRAWYAKLVININSFLYNYLKLDFQKLMCKSQVYREHIEKKRAEILEKFGKPGDVVFVGHSHLPDRLFYNDKTIYDSGSVILDGTYVHIDDDDNIAIKRIKF